MANTDNLGPEYHKDPEKKRLMGRRFVWSRKKSKPWAMTLVVIIGMIVAASAVAVTYLVNAHPGKPEPNPGIEAPANH